MPRRSGAAAAGAYVLLTVVLTWPLARGLTGDLPADFGDPLLNCWVLAWDADHLMRAAGGHFGALREYWNANIFHPHPLGLAYSEHLTVQAVMVLPVYAATRNPILCYNLVFLSTFVLSGLGMRLFVRDLTGCPRAAFFAGVAYAFAPYRFGTLAHLQVLSSMWMPFALLGFYRFLETRRLWPLAMGATAWIAQNLSCGYYFLFFSPVVALFIAWEVTRRRLWTDWHVVGRLAAVTFLVLALTAVFLLPYLELRQLGFSARSAAETNRYAADVYGYFTTDVQMWLWGRTIRAWPMPEGSLFPGFTIVLLAALAVGERWRRARHSAGAETSSIEARVLAVALTVTSAVLIAVLLGWSLRVTAAGVEIRITSLERVAFLVLVLGAALVIRSTRARATARSWFGSSVGVVTALTLFAMAMSFGPQIHAGGKLIEERNIYALFYDFVPGFDGLRVPARFAMIVAAGLAALAGCGAAVLARLRYGTAAVAVATTLVVLESWAVPISINVNSTEFMQTGLAPLPETVGTSTPPVYRFIATLPASAALIELPFGEVAYETRYMFYSIAHWRPLVNGYSGGAPEKYGLWAERFKDVQDRPDAAWQAVVESRASHLVVHEAGYLGGRGQWVSDWARAHGAREVAVFGSDRVFLVPGR